MVEAVLNVDRGAVLQGDDEGIDCTPSELVNFSSWLDN